MKKDLVDISLTELRGFMKNLEELYQIKTSHLSLISIKLRLQFLISKKQFSNFYSFYNFYLNDENYRSTVNSNLIVKGNELFRDAEYWDLFVKELKVSGDKLSICLFELGDFYDTTTFLICLDRFKLNDRINLTIVKADSDEEMDGKIIFNEKAIEAGVINFSILESSQLLTDHIIKEDLNSFVYKPNQNITFMSLNKLIEDCFEFDAIIARNISLNYNFAEHEILFNSYLKLLKSQGILFVGNKESFKWCQQFNHITYSNKLIPIYKKL